MSEVEDLAAGQIGYISGTQLWGRMPGWTACFMGYLSTEACGFRTLSVRKNPETQQLEVTIPAGLTIQQHVGTALQPQAFRNIVLVEASGLKHLTVPPHCRQN